MTPLSALLHRSITFFKTRLFADNEGVMRRLQQGVSFARQGGHYILLYSSALRQNVFANPKYYLTLTVASVILFIAIFGDYGIVQRIRLEHKALVLRNDLMREEARRAHLQHALQRANETEEIERVARERYSLSKDGETVYLIK